MARACDRDSSGTYYVDEVSKGRVLVRGGVLM